MGESIAEQIRALPYVEKAPGLEMPLYWMDEQSGRLAQAVRAYLDSRAAGGYALDRETLDTVIAYVDYVIHAPCWRGGAELEKLRQRIRSKVETPRELAAWMWDCIDIGIDPL